MGLLDLVASQLDTLKKENHKDLPQDFLINHIAATFVETVRWWIDNKCEQSPETVTGYFLAVI